MGYQMNETIFAIDPGTTQTGYVILDISGRVIESGVMDNAAMLERMRNTRPGIGVACEMIACYGMPVGAEVFDTCVWIGQFKHAAHLAGASWEIVYRRECKLHLCGSPRAKDPNVRQAIIDMYGGKEQTKKGGLLHGVKSHAWAALAVGLTASHKQGFKFNPSKK